PHLVEVAERGDHSAGVRTLRPPGDKGLRHIGRVDVVKGGIGGSVGAVVRWCVLIGQSATEPATFDLGHVPHEPEQRQRRRRHRPPTELRGLQATALALQGDTVKIEPGLEHLALWGRPRWRWSWDLHSAPPRTRHRSRVPCQRLLTQPCTALPGYPPRG